MREHRVRGQLFLAAKRYADAEAAFKEALAADPNDADSHTLLALALYSQDREKEALREAQIAIGLDPATADNHYVLALVLLVLNRTDEALHAIREAIRLDPDGARYHALVSRIYMSKRDWGRALEAAEEGLRMDAENVPCANLRAMALVKLGRKVEADQTISAALARDPENALTHANRGWALLHRGEHEQAFTHFREALRLNPMLHWAREGIVEAMKARNPLYRLMLRYFLWMSRLTEEQQWGVSGGMYALRVGLRAVARLFPPLWFVVLPLGLLYFTFAVLTWTARPLFALLLRFDRFGRLALPEEEIVASNWVGLCLLTMLVTLIVGLVLGEVAFFVAAVAALAMVMPVSGIFHCPAGAGRIFLSVYTALLGLVGLAAFVVTTLGSAVGVGVATVLGGVFFVGWVLYSWIAKLVLTLTH